MRKTMFRWLIALAILLPMLCVTEFRVDAAATYYANGKAFPNATYPADGSNQHCQCGNVQRHWCCWNYAVGAYHYIWGQSFGRSYGENMLREVPAAERRLTAYNLERFFSEAAAGAKLRIDNDSDAYAGDNDGHSLIFLGLNSTNDGGIFLEGNYDGRASSRIHNWKWSDLAGYGYSYIKYIMWPGAPTYGQSKVEIGTPVLKDMRETYWTDEEISFSWGVTANTTHYNIFLQSGDGENYDYYENIFYAVSGVTRKLPEGQYRVRVQSTNSNYWTPDGSTWLYVNGDWEYFSVLPHIVNFEKLVNCERYIQLPARQVELYASATDGAPFTSFSGGQQVQSGTYAIMQDGSIRYKTAIEYQGNSMDVWFEYAPDMEIEEKHTFGDILYYESQHPHKAVRKCECGSSRVGSEQQADETCEYCFPDTVVTEKKCNWTLNLNGNMTEAIYLYETENGTKATGYLIPGMDLGSDSQKRLICDQYVQLENGAVRYRIWKCPGWSAIEGSWAEVPSYAIVAKTREHQYCEDSIVYDAIHPHFATMSCVCGEMSTTIQDTEYVDKGCVFCNVVGHPNDVTATHGTTAKFYVAASGSGLTYQWQWKNANSTKWSNSSSTGSKTATLTITAATTINGRQYRCKISDSYGNVLFSNPATLTVKPALAVTANPKSVTAAHGTAAKFSVTASGSGLTYQWQWKNANATTWSNSSSTGSKTATLTITAATTINGRQYRCKITDSNGKTVYSTAATLTVKPALAVTANPKSVTAAHGTAAKFSVTASGSGLTYQWQWKNANATKWSNSSSTGSKTATLTITAATTINGRQYRCKITDANGKVIYSTAATLTVKALAVTANPKSVTAAHGTTAKFSVTATGSGLTYQWQWKNANATTWANSSSTGSKTATLTITAAKNITGRQYRCKITDSTGKAIYSTAATLTVK